MLKESKAGGVAPGSPEGARSATGGEPGAAAEVRAAVTAFKDCYNRHWRLENLGFMSPCEARQVYAMRKAA